MAFVDRQAQYPGRITVTDIQSHEEKVFDVVRTEGTVTVQGTPLDAANLNRETQVDSAVYSKYSQIIGTLQYQNEMSDILDFLHISDTTIQKFIDLGMVDPRL